MQQLQMQAQQQSISMQQAQKDLRSPTQEMIEMLAIQERSKIDAANLSIKERDSETKFLEVMSKIRNSDVENEIRLAEIDAEQTRTQVDAAINISNHINSLTKGDKHEGI